MKLTLAFVAVMSGYVAACIFLSLFALAHEYQISQFRIEMIWAGIYGLPLGFLAFVIPFRRIRSDNPFWHVFIAPLIGGVAGWMILMLLFSELAFSVPFGGFAAVMGFTTFLLGSVFHRSNRRSLPSTEPGHNKPEISSPITPRVD